MPHQEHALPLPLALEIKKLKDITYCLWNVTSVSALPPCREITLPTEEGQAVTCRTICNWEG